MDYKFIKLTPKLTEQIEKSLDHRLKEIDEEYPKLVENCDYKTKLAIAAWIFKAIDDHFNDGGTFRYFIYDRLGFNMDAYFPLYMAGGMNISNAAYDLQEKNNKK